jgi:serine/threonine-protein kinase
MPVTCPSCGHIGESATCPSCGAKRRPAHALRPGTTLAGGTYVISDVLGHGGFGITYRALDTHLQREVAIKELFPEGCVRGGSTVVPARGWSAEALAEARTGFAHEGRLLAGFSHPSVVRVFDHFEENQTAYMVMQLLVGRTLLQRGRLPLPEVLACGQQLAAALAAVHEAGLLHRDINPSNVIAPTSPASS